MAVRDAGPFGETTSAAPADGEGATAKRSPWYRRVAFWRAVAGMALAIAIASAMVTAEFSTALLERTRHFHYRLHQLSTNLDTMRGKVASADREIAGMRLTVEIDDDLRRILAEPDARLIRLAPPGRASQTTGVIAFSPALHRAAMELAGLPVIATGDQMNLWWTRSKRTPIIAAHFIPKAPGKAVLMIALPTADETIEGAMITVDSTAGGSKPESTPILKGTVAPARMPVAKPKHKG
jgi:hypothetical protein